MAPKKRVQKTKKKTNKPSKLWGGRFTKPTDPFVEEFTSSIAVDFVLARYDVLGSIAHAKMLGKCRIISLAESNKLVSGLKKILNRIESGTWKADSKAEDIHTQIEQELGSIVGAVSGKLHAARSRNDQVATDLRLYCKDAVLELLLGLRNLQSSLVKLASDNIEVVIPGYTHLQHAQPVLLAHHLLAYVEMFERDSERLVDAHKRIDVLPLGSGALAGTSLSIDRTYVAKLLGFSNVSDNSMDAVSDRDFVMELIGTLSILGVHISRLAEDSIFWASQEVGMLLLDDAFATGSSLMPQKKNPDVLELVRGQSGIMIGRLSAIHALMKGLPLTYNRDLQEDKTVLFGAVDSSLDMLEVVARLFSNVKIQKLRAKELVDDASLCATDLAELLVERGVAFREAHLIVGQLIRRSEELGKSLDALSLQEMHRVSPHLDQKAKIVLNAHKSISRKQSSGGTGKAQVQKQVKLWSNRLKRS